jgi:hypothetical protein
LHERCRAAAATAAAAHQHLRGRRRRLMSEPQLPAHSRRPTTATATARTAAPRTMAGRDPFGEGPPPSGGPFPPSSSRRAPARLHRPRGPPQTLGRPCLTSPGRRNPAGPATLP